MARQYDIFYSAQDRTYLGQTTPTIAGMTGKLWNTGGSTGTQTVDSYASPILVSQSIFSPIGTPPRGIVGYRSKLTDTDSTVVYGEMARPYLASEREVDLNGSSLYLGAHLSFKPIFTAQNTIDADNFTAISHAFASDGSNATANGGATWTTVGVYQDAAVCVIDLREAPADSRGYTYCLLGSGWINFFNLLSNAVFGATAKAKISTRLIQTDVADPFSGTVFTPSSYTFGNTTHTVGNSTGTDGLYDGGMCSAYNVGGIVDLEPGGLYVFRNQFAIEEDTPVVQVHDAKVMAVRFDRNATTTAIGKIYSGGVATTDEATGAIQASDSSSSSTHRSIAQTESLGSGMRMLASVCCVQANVCDLTDPDAAIEVFQRVPGGSDAESQFTPRLANEPVPVGHVAFDDNSGISRITYATNDPTTVTVTASYPMLAQFVPLFFSEIGDDATGGNSSATTTNATTWKEIDASTGSDFNSRTAERHYVELWKVGAGEENDNYTEFAYVRMNTPNSDVDSYDASINNVGRTQPERFPDRALTGAEDAFRSVFNFLRSKYDTAATGTAEMSLDILTPKDTSGATVRVRDAAFSKAEERTALTVPDGTPLTVVAKINTGLVLRSGWGTDAAAFGDGSYNYFFSLPLVDSTNAPGGIDQALGGVIDLYRNGVKLTQATKAAYDAGTFNLLEWYWDQANRKLRFRMGGSGDNSDEPWDQDLVIVAVVPLYYGRQAANLVSPSGEVIPYSPRLSTMPGSSSQISSSQGVVNSGASLGSVSMINADGALDDLVVRRVLEGHSVELLVGYESVSAEEADFVVYQSGSMAVPSSDANAITVRLFDKSVRLDGRLAGTLLSDGTVTANRGDPGATVTSLPNQSVPVVYGRAKRIPAYRITQTSGVTQSNEYAFSSSVCFDVTAAYVRREDRESQGLTLSSSAANAALGKVEVQNSNLAQMVFGTDYTAGDYASSLIPDVIFVDVWGQENSAGTRPLLYPGEIVNHILTNPGQVTAGLELDEIDTGSLDLLDAYWRPRMATVYNDPGAGSPSTTVGNRFLDGLGVYVAGVFETGLSLRDAANKIAASCFTYITTNRAGRVGVNVADYRSDNLLTNGSFDAAMPEYDGTADTSTTPMIFPWKTINDCVAYRSKAEGTLYSGTFGLAINSATNERAAIEQPVNITAAGTYFVTLMAKLDAASTPAPDTDTKFRIALVLADGSEVLGDALTVDVSGAFGRLTQKFTVPFGSSGKGKIRIYPYYADDASDAANTKHLWLDAVEAYRVVAELDESNLKLSGWEFGYEIYDSVLVAYDVQEGEEYPRRIKANNNEATGAYLVANQTRDSQPSSGDLAMTHHVYDATSATGIAAVTAGYYANQRLQMKVTAYGLTPMRQATDFADELEFKFPVVGDRVYIPNASRVPVGFDAYPVWRIDAVNYKGGLAQEVQLTVSQAVDPINRTRAGSIT